ncbi:MAG: MerC domain-containing protein [Cyanobacteriota/Melainabacteria group bacterium]
MKNENDYRYTGIMNIKVIDCCGSKCSSPGQSSGMGAHAEKQPGPTRVLDLLGILAAVVCLIHCLALPVVMTFLPTLIHHHTHDDFTHVILAGWVLLFCLTAIVPGFVKHGQSHLALRHRSIGSAGCYFILR